MLIKGAYGHEICKALEETNKIYQNNIEFGRFEYLGQTRDGRDKWRVRLRVKDSKGPGARRGMTGRRTVAACWHVHGVFFDHLPEGVEIEAAGRRFHAGDRWQDIQVGSILYPCWMSELCDCDERGIDYVN